MSLQLVPAGGAVTASGGAATGNRRGANAYGGVGATAAVCTASQTVLGLASGDLRVYSRRDQVLERALRAVPSMSRRRSAPVTVLAHVPRTDLVAAVCDSRCALHDLRTRQTVHEFDSTSARFVAGASTSAGSPRAVVGSSYKIRIYRVDLRTTCVLDAPGGQRVRALCSVDHNAVAVAIGNGTPRLWRLDLDTEQLWPLAALPAGPFARGHKFVMCATGAGSAGFTGSASSSVSSGGSGGSVFIGCSAGGALLSRDPLRVVNTYSTPCTAAAVLYSEPTQIALVAVHSGTQIEALNPATGTSLLSVQSSARLLSSQSECSPALAMGGTLLELHCSLDLAAIVSLGRREASSLGFSMGVGSEESSELRALQRDEAAQMFRDGLIDDSMRLFTWLEEQCGDPDNVERVLQLVHEYLAEHAEPPVEAAESSSVFSIRTAPRHPLDPVVGYLAFVRRKLRLQAAAEASGAAAETARASGAPAVVRRVDTTLFLCYFRMKSPLVAPLLRSANSCDAETVRRELLGAGKWRELVLFLRSSGLHRDALDLLIEHHEPPEAVVAYLEHVQGDLPLVFEFARPVVSEQPRLARRLFFEQFGADAAKVYEFLASVSPDTAAEFAAFRVRMNDPTPELHDAVVRGLAGQPDPVLGSVEQFIAKSKHIRPRQLLDGPEQLPPRCRALLHERLGEFKAAIDIYIASDDLETATACAEQHDTATYLFRQLPPEKQPQFLNLVSPASDLRFEDVLQSIKPLNVDSVLPFVVRFVAAAEANRRAAATEEAVGRAALAEYSIDLRAKRAEKYVVEPQAACSICHKRLGRAVSAVTQPGMAHYACFVDQKRKESA